MRAGRDLNPDPQFTERTLCPVELPAPILLASFLPDGTSVGGSTRIWHVYDPNKHYADLDRRSRLGG